MYIEDDVAPDVVWISSCCIAATLGPDGKLHAAPELICEALSPGAAHERRDREAKLKLYSRRGVVQSFNGFHEPIVRSPRDVIRVFYGTGIDALFLGSFVLMKYAELGTLRRENAGYERRTVPEEPLPNTVTKHPNSPDLR